MNAKWRTYGRICPVRGEHYYGDNDKLYVYPVIRILLPDFKPPYAVGTCLIVHTDSHEYRIYNPQKLRFEMTFLLSQFKTHLALIGETFRSYEVDDPDKDW